MKLASFAAVLAVTVGIAGYLGRGNDGSAMPAAEALAAFPAEPAPSRIVNAFGRSDPWYARRYGDRASLTFFAGTSSLAINRTRGVANPEATVTVFASVQGARRSSLAIRRGGLCIAHARNRLSNPFPTCQHYRVRNVLLIVAGWAQPRQRSSLVAALTTLGTPTTA